MEPFIFFVLIPVVTAGLLVFRGQYLEPPRSILSQLLILIIVSFIFLWKYNFVVQALFIVGTFVLAGSWGVAVQNLHIKQHFGDNKDK